MMDNADESIVPGGKPLKIHIILISIINRNNNTHF